MSKATIEATRRDGLLRDEAFPAALEAEWIKIRSVRSTRWLPVVTLLVNVGLGALLSALVAADQKKDDGADYDPLTLVHYGLGIGQLTLMVFAVLAVSGEYGSGTIGPSLTAVPDRRMFLAAKFTVVAGIATVVAVPSAVLSTLAARALMPIGHISLTDPLVWRAAFGHAAYLVLLAVLSTGVAFWLRTPMAALGLLFPLFLVGTVLVTAIPGVAELGGFTPESAGRRITHEHAFEDYELAPWIGLLVMAGWALAGATVGAWKLRNRDT
ncbi:ABC transporter permease [Embleya scabrispora]|uniref:ABC transporter permease n=1 Tax=Embleya scabrispora TaxID=159449 RepID=UPI000379F2FD|nr:ABC transporter permease [Embleya scabrispora]MYS80660.1 ABC transporter permease subunit [Streptomyces sp. SID5474]